MKRSRETHHLCSTHLGDNVALCGKKTGWTDDGDSGEYRVVRSTIASWYTKENVTPGACVVDCPECLARRARCECPLTSPADGDGVQVAAGAVLAAVRKARAS